MAESEGRPDGGAPLPMADRGHRSGLHRPESWAPVAVPARDAPPRRDVVWMLDDSPLEAECARRALADRFAVTTFDDGATMLEQLASADSPDLLLLDWCMPRLSGLDVCRFLRQTRDEIHLPILILTSMGATEDLVEGLAAGANDFATKPFKAPELVARIETLIRSKRLHEKLERTEAALRLEAELRERFVGILGHDLRQPLSTQLLACHALQRAALPAAEAKMVRYMTNASQLMQRMITELLDFTRIRQGGGIPVNPTRADLHSIVRRVLDEFRVAHPERVVELVVVGDGRGTWDPDRLVQLCGNLVGNAIEYSPQDTPVQVAVRDRQTFVELEVANEGPTIPATLLPALFHPFKRAGGTHSKGLGLGLFIAEQVARAHSGAIAVESAGGRTRFVVHLPRSFDGREGHDGSADSVARA